MPATSPIRGRRRVRQAEFIRLAVSIFGPKWKKPTGRLVGRTSKMVRNYAAGSFDIPDAIMDVLRQDEQQPDASIRDQIRMCCLQIKRED